MSAGLNILEVVNDCIGPSSFSPNQDCVLRRLHVEGADGVLLGWPRRLVALRDPRSRPQPGLFLILNTYEKGAAGRVLLGDATAVV
jgi:hypothetical protein